MACAFVCIGCDYLGLSKAEAEVLPKERGNLYVQSIENARKSFDYFNQCLKQADGKHFRVKIAITKKGETPEIIWVTKVSQPQKGVFKGVLETNSRSLAKDKGTSIMVSTRQIVDWSFERSGRLYGNFTEIASGYQRVKNTPKPN